MTLNKNLWVIPTDDKYSRLYFNINDKEFQICEIEKPSTILKPNRHIYITSDKMIDNCWVLNTISGEVFFNNTKLDLVLPVTKKIILTTDPQLIADGVQAINDEFLEWFVAHPSCEEVEFDKKFKANPKYKEGTQLIEKVGYWEYKIIIPKEELTKDEIDRLFVDMICNTKEPKQETLEEFIESYVNKIDRSEDGLVEQCLKDAIKWQQQRSYNEEEVDVLITLLKQTTEYEVLKSFRDKVEQFKKK